MSQPAYNVNELDGTQGVTQPSSGRLALIGPCAGGTVALPQTFGRVKELVAALLGGPTVEAAAHYIERYGKPVVVVPTAKSVAGAYGAIGGTMAGTSVPTADTVVLPQDDYEVYIKVIAGGTRGTAGITYQWSLDGGRTPSPVTALGTAVFIQIGTDVKILLGAGTLVAGDTITCRTTAPAPNSTDLAAAFDALRNSTIQWEIVEIVGPIDATLFDTIELKMQALFSAGRARTWIGNTRMPNLGESEAAYLSALTGIFATKSSKLGALCAGATKVVSSVSGRKYRRPVSFVFAAREASLSEEKNSANPNDGALPCAIRDDNGNPDEHDETLSPGLDDARFVTLRTWDEGPQGVYVNRPRLFSPDGSDFQLVPHRRVMNLANKALREYFIRRLNSEVLVDRKTGYILEQEALEIEAGALAVLEAVLLAKPKASGCSVAISRSDNLLCTKLMNISARVIPLAYVENIVLELGFTNPVLQPVAA